MTRLQAPNRRIVRLVPAVLALAAWLGLNPAAGVACGLIVTENTTLSADISGCEGDGIIVAGNGVTIDLNGYSIVGLRKERTAGIRVQGVKDVTITGGNIAGFERGIYLSNVETASISDVEVNTSRYEGLIAYQSNSVLVKDSVFSNNTRAAIWIYDSNAELNGNLGLDNPNRTFYLSGGTVRMSKNVASGGAYYSAFTFANGYTPSIYSLENNLAEDVVGVGYLFAWGFAGSVEDREGNSAVNTGGVECWTQEGVSCPLDLDSTSTTTSTSPFCGNDICEAGESVCSCSSDCGLPPSEICGDGVDNNCDGATDCDDKSCALDGACYTPPVPVPAECGLPGEVCVTDSDCCSVDCRTNARGNMAGTCR